MGFDLSVHIYEPPALALWAWSCYACDMSRRTKALAPGRTMCGAAVESVYCECGRRVWTATDTPNCLSCGRSVLWFCHAPAKPGYRCKWHVGQPLAECAPSAEELLAVAHRHAGQRVYAKVKALPINQETLAMYWRTELAHLQALRVDAIVAGQSTDRLDSAIRQTLEAISKLALMQGAVSVASDTKFDPSKLADGELAELQRLLESAKTP